MASLIILMIIILFIFLVSLTVFFVYKHFYDKRSNRILENGETPRRKWIAPWALALIVLGVQLLITVVVTVPVFLYTAVASSALVSSIEEEQEPVNADISISDAVNYVVNTDEYELVDENERSGVDYCLYRAEKSDGSTNYIITGHFVMDQLGYAQFEFNFSCDHCGCCMYHDHLNTKIGNDIYFMIELSQEEYMSGDIVLSIKAGSINTDINIGI